MKLVCYKEVEWTWAYDTYKFEVGDIINDTDKIFKGLNITIITNYKEYFMPLASWRNKIIDELLSDD
jgi:hypothetical protein